MGIEILNGDCRISLPHMLPGTVDLAICDPPYGIGIADWDKFKSHDAFLEFSRNWIRMLPRVLKPDASIYLFNTARNCAYLLPILEGEGFHLLNWIIWDKRDGQGRSNKRYSKAQESILFMARSDRWTFNADDVRVPYTEDRSKSGVWHPKTGKRWFPNPGGALCTDVWHITSTKNSERVKGKSVKQDHPTQKPLEMALRMIRASSNPGDLVLDPFAGTGIFAEVCHRLGRNYKGFEINAEYVRLARRRLEQGVVG